MGFLSKTGKVVGLVINYRIDQWFGYEDIKASLSFLKKTWVNLIFPPQTTTIEESFEAAIKRLKLSELDLKSKYLQYQKLFFIYVLSAISVFIYSIVLILFGNISGFMISFALSIYGLANSFRYHFWMFQLKHRKLGCSLKEWLNSSTG